MMQLVRGCVAGCLLVFASYGYAEVLELEGTVKRIDQDARSISVVRKTAKGEKTLDLEVAKKAGDLSEIDEGDSVTFSYDPALELITKIAERSQQAEKIASTGKDDLARPFLDRLLTAIKDNDYDGFVSDTSASYKATLTKQIVAGINEAIAPRMKKGYNLIFLTELKQRGRKSYLWKWSFKDGGDDYSIRLWLKDGKVDGFFIRMQ